MPRSASHFFALILGIASALLKVGEDPLEKEIESILPGANCGQCGELGCKPAAKAFIDGKIPITACTPGGNIVASKLAKKLKVKEARYIEPRSAIIDENKCIGCTRCIQHCSSDGIVGAPKSIHVILSDNCGGCGKCEEQCPVMAISMKTIDITTETWHWKKPNY